MHVGFARSTVSAANVLIKRRSGRFPNGTSPFARFVSTSSTSTPLCLA